MLGEEKLKQYCKKTYQKECVKINDHLYFFYSYGHSNASAIIGDTSIILIDSLDSDEYARNMREKLQEITDKPVKTIIYTHGHPDHRGGSGAFKDTVENVIAFTPCKPMLKYYDRIQDGLNQRGQFQHGYGLSDEEAICQGIGIREGKETGHGKYDLLMPTKLYDQNEVRLTLDGIDLILKRAPGETDDQICIYLPNDKVLFCGDNYYGVFPALYAIRGTQYRDLATWIDTLDLLISYDAKVLLPGHTKALFNESVKDHLTHFKEAIEYILFTTLDCINQHYTLAQTLEKVKLPQNLKELPYLQEYYGMIEWAVKSVYNGYVGWFDGDATHLLPLPEKQYNQVLLEMIGKDKLNQRIEKVMNQEEYQLALQLLEILPNPVVKKQALLGRAKQVTSANARHYYIASSKMKMYEDIQISEKQVQSGQVGDAKFLINETRQKYGL